VTTTRTDGPLALARRRLDDAVYTLASPAPMWADGMRLWVDPLYGRLREALSGGRTVRRRRAHAARPPCRVDVLALLIAIDATVGAWEPHGKGTVDRLRQLAARDWRPQDCRLLDDYSGRLEGWAASAVELLDETPVVALEVPCPSCGASFAYRRGGAGDQVRTRALRVSEAGCACRACGAFWGPERFEWLARLLGCTTL
jgi:hypothetical protein